MNLCYSYLVPKHAILNDFTCSLMDLFDENRDVSGELIPEHILDLENEIRFNEEMIESAQKTDSCIVKSGVIFFTGTCAADLAVSLLWSLNFLPVKCCILLGFSGGITILATGIFLGCYSIVNDGKIRQVTDVLNELKERKNC